MTETPSNSDPAKPTEVVEGDTVPAEASATQGATRVPRVAIVGRPNVGKSTLLNRLAGSRIAIVEPTAGVTRDRIAVPVWIQVSQQPGERVGLEVIDTGGIGIVDRDDLGPHVEEQVHAALGGAELILFLVDVRSGITPLDIEVAKRLRGVETPVILVVNKVEGDNVTWDVDEFRRLGVGDTMLPLSAQNGDGIHNLCDAIYDALPGRLGTLTEDQTEVLTRPVMRLGVVGRRNAGKSSFINALAGEERMIVSEIPGTTRDSVDVRFDFQGRPFVAIDTAGVRKKSKFADAIEFFSDNRAHRTIRRADVLVLMFDVTQKLAALDKRLARYIADHHKPVILGANKWDLVDGFEPEDFQKYLAAELPGLSWAPVSFLSAKFKNGVVDTLKLAEEIYDASQTRVSTGELNRVLERATQARSPSRTGHRVKIMYATQVETAPPKFVLFVNDKRLIGKDYLRYLQNRIREELPFEEVPIQIVLRDKRDQPESLQQ